MGADRVHSRVGLIPHLVSRLQHSLQATEVNLAVPPHEVTPSAHSQRHQQSDNSPGILRTSKVALIRDAVQHLHVSYRGSCMSTLS